MGNFLRVISKYLKLISMFFIVSFGLLLLFVSFFINLEILGKFVAQDKSIDNLLIINYFWLFHFFLFFVGVMILIGVLYKEKIKRTIIKYKKEFILFVVTCIICIIILEFFAFFIIKHNFTHHAFKGEQVYNNIEFNYTVKFNEYGFRDSPFIPTDDYTIAIVGDSFVFGAGVEKNETFEQQIEQELNKEKKVTVYNLGVPGAYPTDYLSVIKEMYPHLQPNFSVVVLYLGNDIMCTKKTKIQSYLFPNLQKLLQIVFQEYTKQKEIKAVLTNPYIKEEYKRKIQEQTINPYFFIEAIYKPNLTQKYYQFIDWFLFCPINQQVLLIIKETINSFGSETLFILLPVNYQVNDYNWDILQDLGYITPSKELLQNRELQDAILQFCEEKKIHCVDMLPYLHESTQSPYFKYDGHFTKIGHNITATIIISTLKQQFY